MEKNPIYCSFLLNTNMVSNKQYFYTIEQDRMRLKDI